jgi:hypothetical protein
MMKVRQAGPIVIAPFRNGRQIIVSIRFPGGRELAITFTHELPGTTLAGDCRRAEFAFYGKQRRPALGECYAKEGVFSGEVYCGWHGREAGWPCAATNGHRG